MVLDVMDYRVLISANDSPLLLQVAWPILSVPLSQTYSHASVTIPHLHRCLLCWLDLLGPSRL
jgi:hypothetical protein